jgi:hypothetical protein
MVQLMTDGTVEGSRGQCGRVVVVVVVVVVCADGWGDRRGRFRFRQSARKASDSLAQYEF